MVRSLILSLLAIGLLPAVFAQAPADLPKAEWWYSHLIGDLLPFWNSPAALGDPLGAFPTTRCNDGTVLNPARPCPEIRNNAWLWGDRNRYLVALSRQTYAYGVFFHVTGDPTFMDYMRAGVSYVRQNSVDRERGGMATQQSAADGSWMPRAEWRDPQQLGYGLLGMSFYYYLTRDPEILPDILAIKNYVFERYYNPSLDALQWLLAANGSTRAEEKRLVAQLDQMNAYMVLLTPILPEPHRSQWKKDMLMLSRIMRQQFYSPNDNLLFLNANSPADLDLSKTGTDFGHTIKAMWMIRFTGLMTGEQELVDWADSSGRKVLERAYLAESGSWAQGVLPGGTIDIDKSWWIYCELDQFAATLAMSDPELAKYLPKTYRYWFDNFVDKQYGEVWTDVDGRTHRPKNSQPKQWPWKNGYHSFEHALVGLISTQQLYGEPVTLYYNFAHRPEDESVRPYFYRGTINGVESSTDWRNGLIWKVTFRDVR